jgi:hypothetical protein
MKIMRGRAFGALLSTTMLLGIVADVGIAPCSVELCGASAAVNDVKRPWSFGQRRVGLFPFGSAQRVRLEGPEVA